MKAKVAADCGCRVYAVTMDGLGCHKDYEVRMCSIHTAAPGLLSAAKALLASLAWEEKRSGTTYNGADGLRAAVAKAGGAENA